jgi:hypothetical protein
VCSGGPAAPAGIVLSISAIRPSVSSLRRKTRGGAFVELEATLSAGAPEQGVGDTVGLFESSEVARIGQ